ncbi:insulinase family protein [Pseudomonas sp. Z5-35]|uniref:M16 family metallopeptidase n=1 Tax=unclassified Pseudomonas TaxID=196821 RepID=UPI003DA7C9C9
MNKSAHVGCLAMLGIALLGCCAQALADTVSNGSTVRLQSLLEPDIVAPKPRPLAVKGWKTTAGSKVLFIRTTASPMFDVHVSFEAGSARSPVPGLAGVTYSMLNEGVPGMASYQAIIDTFQSLGARLGMGIDPQRSAFSLRSLSEMEKRTPALRLFSQILGNPSLSDEALARVKNEAKDILLRDRQNPTDIALQHLKEQLAPEPPYTQPMFGTNEALDALTRQAVQDFHRHAYSAVTAQITLVGDLTLEQAQLISQQISSALPGTSQAASPNAPSSVGTPTNSHLERAQQQTQLLLAQPSVPRKHADYLALDAANVIFKNRLMTELREKRGLVYGTEILHWDWADGALAIISLRTSPHFNQGTQALVRSMFTDYLRDGPTQQEVDQLKGRKRSSIAHDSANNAQILDQLVRINRDDLPLDLDYTVQQIQKLTPRQIKDTLNRHFEADAWHIVTVGPTVEQQPLPAPVPPSTDPLPQDRCRAAQAFMAI